MGLAIRFYKKDYDDENFNIEYEYDKWRENRRDLFHYQDKKLKRYSNTTFDDNAAIQAYNLIEALFKYYKNH